MLLGPSVRHWTKKLRLLCYTWLYTISYSKVLPPNGITRTPQV